MTARRPRTPALAREPAAGEPRAAHQRHAEGDETRARRRDDQREGHHNAGDPDPQRARAQPLEQRRPASRAGPAMAFGRRARRPRTPPPADTPSAPMSRSDCDSRTGRMAARRRREAAIGRRSTTGRRPPAPRGPRVPQPGLRMRRGGRSAAACRARRPFSPSRTPRARSSRARAHTRSTLEIPRVAATPAASVGPRYRAERIHRHEGRWPPAPQAAAERAARPPRPPRRAAGRRAPAFRATCPASDAP